MDVRLTIFYYAVLELSQPVTDLFHPSTSHLLAKTNKAHEHKCGYREERGFEEGPGLSTLARPAYVF